MVEKSARESCRESFAEQFETPWVLRQVETHLFFGFAARHFRFGWVALAASATWLLWAALFGGGELPVYIGRLLGKALFVAVSVVIIVLFTRRQQAILGWFAMTITQGMAALGCVAVGAPASFAKNNGDTVPFVLLGLVWFPGLEFIKRMTPKQKYITMVRIVCSIPLGCWLYANGNWQ